MITTTTLDTPVGSLSLVLDEDGTVLASGFGGLDGLTSRLGLPDDLPPTGTEVRRPVQRAVDRYFAGDLAALDVVPVRQSGGPFAQKAWAAMRGIEPGTPITYAELAERAGSPRASRAAGQACARNMVAPFVPCHRVVPAGGGVGGYAYGAAVKEGLLAHERAWSSGSL
jgi:methylated-DNA-[protein]-cysteine S-methyltransferase